MRLLPAAAIASVAPSSLTARSTGSATPGIASEGCPSCSETLRSITREKVPGEAYDNVLDRLERNLAAKLDILAAVDRQPSRRYACGIVALRPDRDGWIAGYEGVEAVFHRYHELVVGSHFPAPGTPTQPVEAGFMANAWIRMRHPDYDHLREMLDDVGRTVQVHAG